MQIHATVIISSIIFRSLVKWKTMIIIMVFTDNSNRQTMIWTFASLFYFAFERTITD